MQQQQQDEGEMDFDQEELMQLMEAAENPMEKAIDQDFFNKFDDDFMDDDLN
eukprot:EC713248.1.p3 GENE.EC713248.1~~EC713248.1.p3  ORF type:complete len:52 (+),score=22.51 EC713248.1:37-192(+)